MDNLLQVGIISNTHGVRGEVKVFPTTDEASRFKKLKDVILDTGKEKKQLQIEQVKFFKQFVILKFKDYNTMNDVEPFKGKSLLVTRENAVKLKKDEYFIADLIGLRVISDDEEEVGTVLNVIQTGANDVYEVGKPGGKTYYLPAIKECILDIDIEAGEMYIHFMDGLKDL